MAINHNLEFEIREDGGSKNGAGFNPSNSNAGLNYSYGPHFQNISITDLSIDYADAFKPGIPFWTLSNGGSFPGGTYYIGIRYVALGGNGEIRATSELVEYADFIPNNKIVNIQSPSNPGYPFEHYQVFIRELSGSHTYVQLQNYGGGEVASNIGTNLSLNSFSTSFASIPSSSLPHLGNCFLIGSATRNFVSNDIGNFIYLANNNIGFRSRAASEVSNVTITELGKTSSEKLAAWFDVSETKLIQQISVVMWAQGSPSGDLFLELRTDNAGVPSDTILDFGGINANTLSSSPQWVDVSVNSSLAPGRYWIVINFDSMPDLNNYIKVGRKTSNGFQNFNQMHLYQYNSLSFTWSNVDTGIAVAIGVIIDTTEIWGEGDYSPFLLNEGSQRLEILNVSSNKALISSDYYFGDFGYSSGSANIGGACNSLPLINEHSVVNEFHGVAHVKSGTHYITEPISIPHLSIHGYEETHLDSGLKPSFIVDVSANTSLFDYVTGLGIFDITGEAIQISNIEINGNDLVDKLITGTDVSFLLSDCKLSNSLHSGVVLGIGTNKAVYIERTQITNLGGNYSFSAGIYASASNHLFLDQCHFNNIQGCGLYCNNLSLKMDFCILDNIYGSQTNNGNGVIADECTDVRVNFLTINDCSKSGLDFRKSGSFIVSNSLFTNGGDHGIIVDLDFPLSFSLSRVENNAFYNNGGNQFEVNPPLLTQTTPITLTSMPFVHLGLDYNDFTLNSTPGGGADLIGVAKPLGFLGLVSQQKLDIGAVQSFGNQPTPRRNPIVSLF